MKHSSIRSYTHTLTRHCLSSTVGEVCLQWSTLYHCRQKSHGLYLSLRDTGRVKEILQQWPTREHVRAIVFTDGERILGLGDLGANGMGIPVGKMTLYTICAGIHPKHAYIGLRRDRDRSALYDDLIDELINATKDVFGRTVLLQFEDFGNTNAFRLLSHYRESVTCFNDDIQGTAAVILGGLIASLPLTGRSSLDKHTVLFFGAGEAAVGIAELISLALAREKACSMEEARKHCWLVDSHGLISDARGSQQLEAHKRLYAHPLPTTSSISGASPLLHAIHTVKPTVLIGVAGQAGGAFDESVIRTMCALNTHPAHRPVIYALSNPTDKSECTAEQAYSSSNGEVIFASGSPFDPVTLSDGRQFVPGQGNNSYIFRGIALAALLANALCITDEDFLIAAYSLAKTVPESRLAQGCCYPDLKHIREVSAAIAVDVAQHIHLSGRSNEIASTTSATKGDIDWRKRCEEFVYVPRYSDIA